MYFKLTKRNPYRDLLRNQYKIAKTKLSEEDKASEYIMLIDLLNPRLVENTTLLNNQAAFGTRCEFWGQNSTGVITPVTNVKNPWLSLKAAVNDFKNNNKLTVAYIEKELAWFEMSSHKDDWIVD